MINKTNTKTFNDNLIIFNGKTYSSINRLCNSNNINYRAFISFCYRKKDELQNSTLEERINLFKKQERKVFLAPNGRTYPCEAAYCREIGVRPGLVYVRRQNKNIKNIYSDKLFNETKFFVKDHKGKEYKSIKEMCKAYNTNSTIYRYWIKRGKSIEFALTHKKKSTGCVDHKGNKYNSISEMCKVYNISEDLYKKRLKKGMNIEEALTIPKKQINLINKPSKDIYDHKGNKYKTVTDMCKAYNISKSLYNTRLRKGFTIEEALTTPKTNLMRPINPGDKFLTNCGLYATVLSIDNNKINMEIEDGTIITVNRQNVLQNKISHPVIKNNRKKYEYRKFTVKYSAKTTHNTYYECKCNICGLVGVMTLKETLTHKCISV